jgi:transcriptional regulator with XRE-family HTH domain
MRTKIRTLREGKGFSQSQMAEKLNMDERNYKRIETGERKLMDTEMLMRIAEVLDVDAADLLVNETVNIENNDVHDNEVEGTTVSGIVGNQNNHNAFPDELKEAYKDMMRLMRELIEEKDRVTAEKEKAIALLQTLLDKK